MPDGQRTTYKVRLFELKDYSFDELFEKNLLLLLPFYLLKHEQVIKKAYEQGKPLDQKIINETGRLSALLGRQCNDDTTAHYYTDIIQYVKDVIDYIVKSNAEKVRLYKTMGGEILELESERLMRIGREEGLEEDLE